MGSNLRRLAKDHTSLHRDGLPPYYIFPTGAAHSSMSSDSLTRLSVLLTGPPGTPYYQGLWQLQLRIPEDYPTSPPKAAFRTRIWHPNVDETSGAICVDTLKRDWDPVLTLKDVLTTISCLLIHPNPDSALNPAAGALLQDDYDSFARQASLMTSIHASIPNDLKESVIDARRRGDEPASGESFRGLAESNAGLAKASADSNSSSTTSTVTMKARSHRLDAIPTNGQKAAKKLDIRVRQDVISTHNHQAYEAPFSESEDEEGSKENNPSLSKSPVTIPKTSPRKSVLGKRPLSVIATCEEPDLVLIDDDDDDGGGCDDNDAEFSGMTASEKNIAANSIACTKETKPVPNSSQDNAPRRKSPKLSNTISKPCIPPNDSLFVIRHDDISPQVMPKVPNKLKSEDEATNLKGPFLSAMDKGKNQESNLSPTAHLTPDAACSTLELKLSMPACKTSVVRKLNVPVRIKPRTGLRRL
ncbi:hypothetical protein FQN57_006903 [Myotisia sp. PD_48]|nr:hypothetical protein FQN57_006903 [Myotisia sp. PD_48]